MTFTLMRDVEPVADLEPYLGAAAHVTIASADTQGFAHTHGEARGAAHETDVDTHEGHEGSNDTALVPEIALNTHSLAPASTKSGNG